MLLPHWEHVIFLFLPGFTHFHPFSHFCSFPPHPLLSRFSPPWGPREGRGDVAILMNGQCKMDTWGNEIDISTQVKASGLPPQNLDTLKFCLNIVI